MHYARPLFSPTSPDLNLGVKTTPVMEYEDHVIRSNVGTLLYLATKGRPELCLAASMLASHVAEHSHHQINGVSRILRYRKGTKNMMMQLSRGLNKSTDSTCQLKLGSRTRDRRRESNRHHHPLWVRINLHNQCLPRSVLL